MRNFASHRLIGQRAHSEIGGMQLDCDAPVSPAHDLMRQRVAMRLYSMYEAGDRQARQHAPHRSVLNGCRAFAGSGKTDDQDGFLISDKARDRSMLARLTAPFSLLVNPGSAF